MESKKTVLQVPQFVMTDGEFLLYDTGAPDERRAEPLAFHQFLRLDPGDPEQIVQFAGRWGALGLCAEHGMPLGHPIRGNMSRSKPCWPRKVKRDGKYWFAEPLSVWRRMAEKSAALLRVARKIELRKPGEFADWEIIEGHVDDTDPVWENLNTARSFLARAIEDWLTIGGVGPRFDWDYQEGNWMLRHDIPAGPWNLFGWLALRLAVEIRGGRFAMCSNCGRAHHVARLPSEGKPSYCASKECRQALWRNNKRKKAKARGKGQGKKAGA